LASLVAFIICISERLLSFAIDTEWEPHSLKLSRRLLALWRAWIYSIVTSLRLCYMLVAMTFHIGLLLVIVVTLSSAQFFIELQRLPKPPSISRGLGPDLQPLLSQNQQLFKTRPRSKSKPDEIFIHPTESNIARADAVALELGLGGDTERVTSHFYSREVPAWETGKGRDIAKQMLAGPAEIPHAQRQSHEQFFIGKGSDSESD